MKAQSIILGLTGQTGAGKTTASNAMKGLGCFIINADLIAKEVILNNKSCIDKLVKVFGDDIKDKNNSIDKKKLAKKAFASHENTKKLNEITHPYIVNNINNKISELKSQKIEIIILDAPLLIESGLDEICDIIVSVICDKDVRIERIMERDSLTKSEALLRINAQKGDDFYISKSHYVLNGNCKQDDFCNNAKNLISYIREEFHVKTHSQHFC